MKNLPEVPNESEWSFVKLPIGYSNVAAQPFECQNMGRGKAHPQTAQSQLQSGICAETSNGFAICDENCNGDCKNVAILLGFCLFYTSDSFDLHRSRLLHNLDISHSLDRHFRWLHFGGYQALTLSSSNCSNGHLRPPWRGQCQSRQLFGKFVYELPVWVCLVDKPVVGCVVDGRI